VAGPQERPTSGPNLHIVVENRCVQSRIVLLDLLTAILLLAAVRVAHADDSKDLTKIPIADSPSYAKSRWSSASAITSSCGS